MVKKYKLKYGCSNKNSKQNVALLDESVASKLKHWKHSAKDKTKTKKKADKQFKLVMYLLRKNNVRYLCITDKLFAEILGYGDIKERIVSINNSQINVEREKVRKALVSDSNDIENVVNEYIAFLESLFSANIPQTLLRFKILEETKKVLKGYPFRSKFKFFAKNILGYANNITQSEKLYEQFIEVLVRNAVISYTLDAINMREIGAVNQEKALDNYDNIINKLLCKYMPKGLLTSELILLLGSLGFKIETIDNASKKARPLFYQKKDIVDSELQHPVFYGLTIDDKQCPITVFTAEPSETVEKRLKYYLKCIETTLEQQLKYFNLLETDPRIILKAETLGQTVVVDCKQMKYYRIPTSKYITQKWINSYSNLPPRPSLEAMFCEINQFRAARRARL